MIFRYQNFKIYHRWPILFTAIKWNETPFNQANMIGYWWFRDPQRVLQALLLDLSDVKFIKESSTEISCIC